MSRILKIAHRGYCEKYPENTMLAFEKAIEAGADMIELDVHLTADGSLVVIHDDDIDRTSNGSGRVGDMTIDELRRYNYNCNSPDAGFCSIPALEEVIGLVQGKCQLNIEIKNLPSRYEGIEDKVISLVKKMDFTDDAVLSSFDHYCLMTIKEIDPAIKTGMLYDSLWLSFYSEVDKLQCYSVHPSVDAFDTTQMQWACSKGLKIFPWVAKDSVTLKRLVDTKLVDGVMVNELELFGSC